MADTVSVTQEDRALYLALRIFHTCEDKMILSGWADETQEMQLIARHRLASTQPAPAFPREEVANALEAALCAPDWPTSLGHVHDAAALLQGKQP